MTVNATVQARAGLSTNFWTSAGFAIAVLIIGMLVLWAAAGSVPRQTTWLASFLLIVSVIGLAGYAITGLWRGAFIDNRNLISLSRVQLLIWTAVGLSAYGAAAISNQVRGATDPLSIAIPEELWVLMGITTTSLVGTGLILSDKAKRKPTGGSTPPAFASLTQANTTDFSSQGVLLTKNDAAKASWSDLISGEELGNARYLDVAKLQMLFFTVILAITYVAALADSFSGPSTTITELPAFSDGALAILGISHAGYLSAKATPHS